MDVPRYPNVLIITDAAINIFPTLEDKVDIVQNAIDLAHALKIEKAQGGGRPPSWASSFRDYCRPDLSGLAGAFAVVTIECKPVAHRFR